LVRVVDFDFSRLPQQLAGRGSLLPSQMVVCQRDAALHYAVRPPRDGVHRHGSDDFVGDHDAADALGEALEPLRTCPEPRLLARLELRANLDDPIVEGVLREQGVGKRAATGAELENWIAKLFELPGEGAAKERAELGRGD